jgi:AcrR family transcriptional regulator
MSPIASEEETFVRGHRLRADVRRRLVVKVAFNFIAEHGFENFRTRDIASLAGINSATLHHHFPTKEHLVAAVADELAGAFMSEKSALRAPLPRSAEEALRAQFNDARYYRDHRPELLAVYREFVARSPRDHVIHDIVMRLAGTWRGDIGQIINRGIEDGSFRRDLHVSAVTEVILNAIWGSVSNLTPASVSFHEVCDELMALLTGQAKSAARGAL